jgi:hypothetical protein
MSTLPNLSEQELKLIAVVYTRLGAAEPLPTSGRLPDQIGCPWNWIPTKGSYPRREADPVLSPDERLVYDAIVREGRFLAARCVSSTRAR